MSAFKTLPNPTYVRVKDDDGSWLICRALRANLLKKEGKTVYWVEIRALGTRTWQIIEPRDVLDPNLLDFAHDYGTKPKLFEK